MLMDVQTVIMLHCAGKLVERIPASAVLWKHGPRGQVCNCDTQVSLSSLSQASGISTSP